MTGQVADANGFGRQNYFGKLVLNTSAGFALALSFLTTFTAVGQYEPLISLAKWISDIVPTVDKVGSLVGGSSHVTLAIQWIFAPIYLSSMVATALGRLFPEIHSSAERKRLARKSMLGLVTMGIAGCLVWGDFVGKTLPSFYRGTMWDPTIPLPWTRLPYNGPFGLLITAFFAPLADTIVYFLILTWICQVLSVLKFRPESRDQQV